MKTFPLTVCASALLVSLTSGCGGLSNARAIDYRNTRTLPSLEIPPDLASVPDANRAGAAEGAAGATTYSGYAGRRVTRSTRTDPVLPEYPNVKVVREGQTRFLTVKAEPTVVWSEVREFLTQNGLSIARENAKAGLIETEWAENHALVGASSDSRLAKWIHSFFATGIRDKYRVRLERGITPGTVEVYLTHSGMEEVQLDQSSYTRDDEVAWRPRPSDPELEAEMLQRLVVFLGGGASAELTTAKAPATIGASETTAPESRAPPPSARLTHNGNGAALLTLEDSLERAWRRVGLSLDRIGFTVEDRDRSKGIYYVRYIDPDAQAKEKGFFSRLFSGSEPAPSNQYQVYVRSAENGTNVEVLDKQGDPEASKTGERILSLLYEQLK